MVVLARRNRGLVSWSFSGEVVVPDHSSVSGRRRCRSGPSWRRSLSSGPKRPRAPGVIGLVWQGGHAIVGPCRRLDETENTVTRRLLDVHGYLAAGKEVAISTYVYSGDPREALGLPFRTVEVHGELGPMPAWLIPSTGCPGRDLGDRRARDQQRPRKRACGSSPTLHRLGITSLLISYRDDLGAPASPDGLHHMGQTEWRDLQAAARYALAHGATPPRPRSATRWEARSSHSSWSARRWPAGSSQLILDAPVLDWRRVLEFNATAWDFPALAATPVEWAIDARDRSRLGQPRRACPPEDFQLPILLFHGEEDEVVPIEGSDEFAAELPQLGHLHSACRMPVTRRVERGPRPVRPRAPLYRKIGEIRRARPWVGLEGRTGGDLLSQGVAPQVPSAQSGLTALFGMGRGVSHSLCATGIFRDIAPVELENRTSA